jgi:hypothetical protein
MGSNPWPETKISLTLEQPMRTNGTGAFNSNLFKLTFLIYAKMISIMHIEDNMNMTMNCSDIM